MASPHSLLYPIEEARLIEGVAMRKTLTSLAAFIACTVGTPVLADPLQPSSGLTIDVGGGLVTRPKFLGSSDYSQAFAPVLEGRFGGDLRLSLDDGVTWTPVHLGIFSVGPVVEFRQSYSTIRLDRGPRASDTFEAGGVVRAETGLGEFEARVRHGLGGDELSSADMTYDALAPVARKMFVAFGAHGSWANEAFSLASYRRRGRLFTPTGQHDYYAVGLQSSVIYEFNDNYRAALVGSFDRLITPDTANLTLATHNIASVAIVFTRRFHWSNFKAW
jgi:hypothetical protein